MTTEKPLRCQDCRHYADDDLSGMKGRCSYPVPRYLQLSAAHWVIGYEANDCLVFESATDPDGDTE